ncbi:MAG: SOS response-associated peptidase [Mycobacterium sp.]
MCGRFAVTTDPARLAVQLDAVNETGIESGGANYNVAPSADIATLVARHHDTEDPDVDDVARRLRLMRWGMLPRWMKQGARPLINARAETVTTSPAFRDAAKRKRCLVPMDGYYEWQAPGDVSGGRKTPFYFSRPDGSPLLVAGLWSVWRPDPEGAPMLTCTVITTDAVGELASVHDRMPLILGERDWDRWLDPDEPAPADLLAAPPDIADLAMREVSTLVNRVANNGPELIEPAAPGNQPVGLF